ncbi:hypothetical protein NDU88_006258 [Pleurodeles waltl]|uniref:Uncharacterized protein n=1 Tax=Pleurodeles waltl TaxID=8319 RepID=A0AAV7RQQ5_PLEWA|nr:hypothetical protein NDU88_006258 [Pleurodeles waltl]
MTYDAEGVINIRREDGRGRSGEKKEEPRTRGSRSEEIAIGASEEEKETAVTGEPTTERETAITRGPEEEKDTVEEEPRTRGSRSEEIAIGASEEEKETAVTGEPTTERETAITRGPEEEKDTVEVGESVAAKGSTAIRVPRTEEETQKSGRLEGRRNHWATPGPDEEKSGDHPRAGRAPGGTWPSQVRLYPAWQTLSGWLTGKRGRGGKEREDGKTS